MKWVQEEDGQMDRTGYLEILKAKASNHGVALDDTQADLILSHLEFVIEKNKVVNLTRVDTIEEGLTLHVEDSLTIVPFIGEEEGRLCDIGTGGGFPGLPAAIASGIDAVLLDSVKKKAAAVQEFIDSCDLGSITVKTLGERAEDVAKMQKESFGVVTARAVSSAPALVELASPLLRHGGKLVVMKAKPEEDEVLRGIKVANLVGMALAEDKTITIGAGDISRRILVFEKTGKSKVKLPRRVGLAQSKPLA